MALTFADTHYMITILTKSDASKGFDQVIGFLNASVIKYALTVNSNIYVFVIKQFWSSVLVKKVNDVVRLQALIDRKKVIITEDTVREALHLDDADSIDYLPNEEIFAELVRMGAQVSDLSSHTTKYSSPALTRKVFANMRRVRKGFYGVETPLFEGMTVAQQVDDVADEGVVGVDVDDVSAVNAEPNIPLPIPTTQSPPPSQEQEQPSTLQKVESLEQDKVAQALEITKLKQIVKKLERKNKLKVSRLRRLKKVRTAQMVESSKDTVMDDVSKYEEVIANVDADEDVTLKDVVAVAKEVKVEKDAEVKKDTYVHGRPVESQAQIYKIDLEHAYKVLSMQDDEPEPAELKEVVEVVTTAKLMT
uniref:Xylulose kinase-1 n=1 Tax=Tanacetum cinerariifolium TaxID=118510 RepID=A0A699GV04_TANCI|nr:hypothetical protein [Tanacetum cinerariifolium]